MPTEWIDVAFVRGGTSKGLFFRGEDLPASRAERDAILCAALGSPDPFGRQLDGMGGGISSLSKAMLVTRSERPGIDLDTTFAQVAVDAAAVDGSGNCGNLSAGVVPFALAAGIIARPDGPQEFALHNTNTGQTLLVRLTVEGGQAAVRGGLAIPGVAGTGAPVELVTLDPGGSRTAGALPSGSPVDRLAVIDAAGHPCGIDVSLVDAAIPLVLVPAAAVGLRGTETPEQLDADAAALALLDALRRAGAVRMGICRTPETAPLAVPKIAVVAPPAPATLLDGTRLAADGADLSVRVISMGRAHRAVPGTGAMCLAAAALIPGTVVAAAVAAGRGTGAAVADGDESAGIGAGGGSGGSLRIGTPSGVVAAAASCCPAAQGADPVASASTAGAPSIAWASLFRTARILMRGQVAVER